MTMQSRFFKLTFFALSVAAAAFAQPTITAVENAASNTPPGLPNAGIAQGSMFVVKGSGLGPATFTQATTFPLPASVGNTSIKVTVGGATVDAIMFYSLAQQVAAILPSKTPTGTGTVTVTYNNQSATAPVTVVANNIGIYTVTTSGTGDAIAFLASDSGLITPTHAANPGDLVAIWGTGLGAVSGDETQPAVQSNLTNIPLKVFIGGQEAKITFQGRNGCCSSADSIYVTVPNGVSGCAVSVNMQIGNMVSNSTSIAVAASGRSCTPTSQAVYGGGTGTQKFGAVGLQRTVESTSVLGMNTTTKMDSAFASFEKVTYPNTPPTGAQLDINSYGSCSVYSFSSNSGPTTPSNPGTSYTGTVTSLDAGSAINMAAPFGNKSMPKMTQAGFISYGMNLDQTASTFTAGRYTFDNGSGTPDVGAFTASYTMPAPFTWTNQSSITTVARANGLTVNWSGGDPNGYVSISGASYAFGASAESVIGAVFTCTAPVSAGSFTVPSTVLLALPASGMIPGLNTVEPGSLTVDSIGSAQPFTATGLDFGAVYSSFVYATSVTYQ